MKSTKIRLVAAFFGILAALCAIFGFFEVRMYYQRRENNFHLAANQTSLMEGSLDSVMSRVYTLRSLVKTNDGSTDFFEDSVDAIYQETISDTDLYVKNFILAPDGIVEKIYPMKGNESLVGFDYMDETQPGNADAIKAYKQNKVVLTDPFSLKQGGTGIAARLPVYMENGEKEEFWGLVAVTLDMDYLLKEFNLDYLEKTGTNYCLSYTNTSGEKVVLANSTTLPKHPVDATMDAMNLTWTLEVEPKSGWIPPMEIGIGAVASLAISLIILRILETRARMRAMNNILEEIAIRDNLTGCYSRHYVTTMLLAPDSNQWRDPNSCYSLAVIDVDSFKQINDSYGHDVGDKALVSIAHILQSLRDELRGDCVIRYGGDEFIFLMNDVFQETFEARLKAILTNVQEIRLSEAPDMRLSVSIGAVLGNKNLTYYELFSLADKQVYLSKEGGKNQYHLDIPEAQ